MLKDLDEFLVQATDCPESIVLQKRLWLLGCMNSARKEGMESLTTLDV
jgi:hypothetical protein